MRQKADEHAVDHEHAEELPGQPFPAFIHETTTVVGAVGDAQRSQRRYLEGIAADRKQQAQPDQHDQGKAKQQPIAAQGQHDRIQQRLHLQRKQKEAVEPLPERRDLPFGRVLDPISAAYRIQCLLPRAGPVRPALFIVSRQYKAAEVARTPAIWPFILLSKDILPTTVDLAQDLPYAT